MKKLPYAQSQYSVLLLKNEDLRAFLKRRLAIHYEIHEAQNASPEFLLLMILFPT